MLSVTHVPPVMFYGEANGSKMPESYTKFSVNRHNLPPKQAEAGKMGKPSA